MFPCLAVALAVLGAARDSSPASLRVASITTPVHIDGRLDDPAWRLADSITDFRQREPSEGAPASERMVVRVLRDADALYVGVRLYDREAAQIRATGLRRDADLAAYDDNVTLLIDGQRDHRSGFLFATNPNGAMWDAGITLQDEADENWNGIWSVATSRDADGWTAEFRIPFRTLRFRDEPDASFGFNVRRVIRRKNEEDLWQGWHRAQGLYRQQYEGTLIGLGRLERPRAVDVMPYALGQAAWDNHAVSGASLGGGGLDGKAGLDTKIAVTPTLTGDLTLNTDFAQVDADQQVINLTRFPLFFPEKREFFLESSGIFSFGFNEITQLFYSRRVGLIQDSAGNTAAVPIVAGARLYGKSGPWTIGLLDARTGGADDANDAVVRVKRDLFDRSYVGLMGTMRTAPGGGGAQQALGFDADFPLVVHGQNIEPTFWLAGSRVPGVPGTPVAFRVATDFPNDLFDNFASLYRVERGFTPTLGFFRRTGVWETTGHVDFQPRPHVLGIRQLSIKAPIPEWDIIVPEGGALGRTGDWQTAWFEWRPLGGQFQSGDLFEINFQRQLDAPTDSFQIFTGVAVPPGRYWWNRWELQYQTSPARPLSAWALVSWGGVYGGRGTEWSLQGAWRPGGHVILSLDGTTTSARLPAGSFVATQLSGRLEYAFDTRTSFMGFAQWNNEDQRVDFNLRFHWIPVIGDDVYVVWNSGYTTDPTAPFRFPDRRAWSRPLNGALVVKAVHRFAA